MTTISQPARRLGPGGAIRFALKAADGARSSTWRVWTSKTKLDVYVANRTTAGITKVSLHESGSWQCGFVSDEKAQRWVTEGSSRHADIWQQPEEFAEGWTRALAIVLRESELRPWPSTIAPKPGDVVVLPPVGPDHAACVEVLIARPRSQVIEFDEPVYDLAELQRPDASSVRLIARRVEVSPDQAAWLERAKAEALRRAPAGVESMLVEALAPRLTLWGFLHDEQQTRAVFDVAATGTRQQPHVGSTLASGPLPVSTSRVPHSSPRTSGNAP